MVGYGTSWLLRQKRFWGSDCYPGRTNHLMLVQITCRHTDGLWCIAVTGYRNGVRAA
jgi:hypothetical protein